MTSVSYEQIRNWQLSRQVPAGGCKLSHIQSCDHDIPPHTHFTRLLLVHVSVQVRELDETF